MGKLNKDQEQSLQYFKECIKKDNVYEEELTLWSMKNALEIIEMYKKDSEENHILKERLDNYIPRRRVRRIYKELREILERDIDTDVKKDIEKIKEFIKRIEVNGKAEADQDIKTSIEHLLQIAILDDVNSDKIKVLNKTINLMAENLTSPLHDKKFVIDYYLECAANKIKEEDK